MTQRQTAGSALFAESLLPLVYTAQGFASSSRDVLTMKSLVMSYVTVFHVYCC